MPTRPASQARANITRKRRTNRQHECSSRNILGGGEQSAHPSSVATLVVPRIRSLRRCAHLRPKNRSPVPHTMSVGTLSWASWGLTAARSADEPPSSPFQYLRVCLLRLSGARLPAPHRDVPQGLWRCDTPAPKAATNRQPDQTIQPVAYRLSQPNGDSPARRCARTRDTHRVGTSRGGVGEGRAHSLANTQAATPTILSPLCCTIERWTRPALRLAGPGWPPSCAVVTATPAITRSTL
jgi:hypothetical protein